MYKTGVSTMNERTKQLWKESQQWNGSDDGRGGLKILESVEKFAEFIVRECINIGDNYEEILGNEPECFNCRKVAYGIVDKIKNHFGVGE